MNSYSQKVVFSYAPRLPDPDLHLSEPRDYPVPLGVEEPAQIAEFGPVGETIAHLPGVPPAH
jgi:hypothetical protein